MEPQRFRRGDRLNVKIERLSIGGRGVARSNGIVIFIPEVLPFEEVEVELTRVKKSYAEARVISLLKTSPQRVLPPCPVAKECSGCNWQHITYQEQLIQKRQLLQEALQKFSGYEIADELVLPTIASPHQFRYRNRIQLHHSGAKVGFHKRGTHQLVDIEDCLIAEEIIAKEIPKLKKAFAHNKAGRVEIYATESGKALIRQESEGNESEDRAFAQVNTEQNYELIRRVQELLTRIRTKGAVTSVYDLYAGSGNFSFPLAKANPEIGFIAVELNRESVQSAELKMKNERTENIRFECQDVEEFLTSQPLTSNDVIILDPPRTGCSPGVLKHLGEGSPAHLIYISCHPVTLARDLGLLRNYQYKLVYVQPIDMFPQTDHIETVVHLQKA